MRQLLVTLLVSVGCATGGCGAPSASLLDGVPGDALEARGAAAAPDKCGPTTVFGNLYPGIVICGKPVLPVHISGTLGDAAQLGIRGPSGYALTTPMNRAGKSCVYQYQWRLGKTPAPGAYTLTVSSSAPAYSFDVIVQSGRGCRDGDGDGDDNTTTGGASTGGGGATGGSNSGDGGATGGNDTGPSTDAGLTTTGGTGGSSLPCAGCGDCADLQTCWSGACVPCSSSAFCCAGLLCIQGQCISPY
jgi:hypothetical protein